MTAPQATDPRVRPADGSCSQWLGHAYCRGAVGVRYFQPGFRCPLHTPAALAGQPEPLPGPGIAAYRTGPAHNNAPRQESRGGEGER